MLEDFWLPRREGGRGTEITTLPGGENLGQIADIEYFQNKVYQSLNIPLSRFQQNSGFNFGRQAEISNDEIKFAKFIGRLRRKFNALFDDLLETQLVLKGIITPEDWDSIRSKIDYKYAQDQYYQEMKNAENLRNRVDVLNQMSPYVGIYYSKDYIRKNVLRLTDDQIKQIEKEMPKIHLEYLPAYSPDYNLIELVWHSAKEYLAHRLFKSVKELEMVLNNLLNEGGLVIKWNRKLKNKGNSVNAV
jgi:transposase